MRRFEEVKGGSRKFPNIKTILPERADARSAGYDFYSKEAFVIEPHSEHMTWTDVKVKMYFDNVLQVYTRSGNGVKHGIIIKNNVGVIDAGYYGNESNDGNIGICLVNTSDEPFVVQIGDRIAQGIFYRYFIAEDDKFLTKDAEETQRVGGFGSTGK